MVEKKDEPGSAPEKKGFLYSLWRAIFRKKYKTVVSETSESEKKIEEEPAVPPQEEKEEEPEPDKPDGELIYFEKERQKAKKKYAQKKARRAQKEAELVQLHHREVAKNKLRVLGESEYLSDEKIEAALQEKRAGEDRPMRKSEILQSYPGKPQSKLDLHKFTAKEAKLKIDFFIRTAHKDGQKTIIIIMGRGIHSKEGQSKLRNVTEEKVVELKKEGLILHFKWENLRKSKSGAMIVYLK